MSNIENLGSLKFNHLGFWIYSSSNQTHTPNKCFHSPRNHSHATVHLHPSAPGDPIEAPEKVTLVTVESTNLHKKKNCNHDGSRWMLRRKFSTSLCPELTGNPAPWGRTHEPGCMSSWKVSTVQLRLSQPARVSSMEAAKKGFPKWWCFCLLIKTKFPWGSTNKLFFHTYLDSW